MARVGASSSSADALVLAALLLHYLAHAERKDEESNARPRTPGERRSKPDEIRPHARHVRRWCQGRWWQRWRWRRDGDQTSSFFSSSQACGMSGGRPGRGDGGGASGDGGGAGEGESGGGDGGGGPAGGGGGGDGDGGGGGGRGGGFEAAKAAVATAVAGGVVVGRARTRACICGVALAIVDVSCTYGTGCRPQSRRGGMRLIAQNSRWEAAIEAETEVDCLNHVQNSPAAGTTKSSTGFTMECLLIAAGSRCGSHFIAPPPASSPSTASHAGTCQYPSLLCRSARAPTRPSRC